ncbi:MAG TPA: hypothetical protein VLT90_01680 [Terriglobales bacterium]|nr:hypothetical protein [Terriglobales bacterium]
MRTRRLPSAVVLYLCALAPAFAETFATFPDQKELPSPDNRYVIRSLDAGHAPSDFTGMFHSLIVEDRATGNVRRLCDYLHKISVAWSGGGIIATDYVSRRGSRALVFPVASENEAYIVDRMDLAGRVPWDIGASLRENDHVFVEAVRMEDRTLVLRAWGYGVHNPRGFHMACELKLDQGAASCRDTRPVGP